MTPHEIAATTHPRSDWRRVDEGWGRRAVDFATLSEPANCREYTAMQQLLGVAAPDRVLDVACGSGLALELAGVRGATCAGIDASQRLIEIAKDRNPDADLRVGDMHELPWDDSTFEVVTSFRGIWGTTTDAVAEVRRVLQPGGRLGLTVWGHVKASPGAWALAPFRLASEPKVKNQAAMVALGRPGAGEAVLARFGLVDIERVSIAFAWEFPDPVSYARALAATGPAYEAIQTVGEDAFVQSAIDVAKERVRAGLPLRAQIDVVGYTARKAPPRPRRSRQNGSSDAGFLAVPDATPEVERLYQDDVDKLGYVMNKSRLWAHRPDTHDGLFELLGQTAQAGSLTYRQRSVLVSACASALGDAYCSLAWGNRLAGEAGAEAAGAVLRGLDDALDPQERALAKWARQITRDPNSTEAADVQSLRDAGFDDEQVFAITVFVALRIAFSTVNDALGALPDRALADSVPTPVRDAVTYGRPTARKRPATC